MVNLRTVNKVVFVFICLLGAYFLFGAIQEDREKARGEIAKLKDDLRQAQYEMDRLDVENKVLNIRLDFHRVKNSWKVDLTAYTAREEETNSDPGNTAIMEKPRPGLTIAVSHDLQFLLGKRVYVKGFGVRRVNDLMNSRYTKRIDILTNSVERAREIELQKNVELVLIEPELVFAEMAGSMLKLLNLENEKIPYSLWAKN